MDSCLEGDHDHFAALQEFELTNFDVNLPVKNSPSRPASNAPDSDFDPVTVSSVCVRVCLSSCVQRLNALAALVRGELPILHRNIITALITIDVHARDIVTDLIHQKVTFAE